MQCTTSATWWWQKTREMQLLFNLAQFFLLLMSPDNRICQLQKIVTMEIPLSGISYRCNEGIQK